LIQDSSWISNNHALDTKIWAWTSTRYFIKRNKDQSFMILPSLIFL
jgi:hypothetical protein